jgi:N-acetylneuraminic acid mutarotase
MPHWTRLPLQAGAALPLARSSHSLTALGRSLLLFGGEHAPRVPIEDGPAVHCYELDAAEPRWRELHPSDGAAPRPCARVAHAAAAVGDALYVFGGRKGVDEKTPMGDLWAFDTRARAWRQLEHADGPPARSYHAAAALGASLYIFGGCGTAGRLSDLWRYDTASGT